MIILTLGTILFSLDHLIILGFSTRVMKWKIKFIFQLGFKNDDYFLVPLRISFVLKFLKDTNILWNMEATWFLFLVHKYYSFFQDFKFLGSCVGTLSNHKWFQFPFPHIWRGNSKSNGGPISLFLLHNKFLVSEIRFPPKTLIQSLERPPFKSFLITFCYHDLLLPLTKISKCVSKCSDKKF